MIRCPIKIFANCLTYLQIPEFCFYNLCKFDKSHLKERDVKLRTHIFCFRVNVMQKIIFPCSRHEGMELDMV